MTTSALAAIPTVARPRKWLHSIFGIACLLLLLSVRLVGGMPIGLIYDPNRLHCLTNVHLGTFVRIHPAQFHRDELVMFPPVPALSYVREPYVLKRVAAVAGDHLVIRDESVSINGREVVRGLPLASYYKQSSQQFQRDETVPAGKLFVIGDASLSDDSRYWGYLDASKVVGTAHRLF